MSKVDLITLALAKKYTDKSMEGGGAVAGKNCTIESIIPITGGNRVTYKWYLDDGTEQTDTMDVMDGQDGNAGNGIASVEKTGTSGLLDTYTITFTNGDTTTFTVTNGADGEDGEGVPTGGTAGQVLVKKSSEDYDTEWNTPAGGGDMLKSEYDTDNDGKVDSAENADKVNGHTVAKDVPADAKFTDTVYDDTEIRGDIADKVDKVDGKGLSTEDYTYEEKTKLAGVEESAEVNTIESITLNGTEVTPDANKNVALTVITKAVNDLVNYYLKSETYSKTEVDDIVTAIKNSRFEVVATLPTTDIKTNVIYLVPKSPSQTSNVKDEYINLDGTTAGWEKIGDTEIDLSNYVTTQALNTALAAYTTTADLTSLLAGKQDTLTFDNAPTENSNNPVKSGGVYADEKSIYEVMGQMGAKNLLPNNIYGTTTNNGVTVSRNDDGSLNVSGTNTSDNVISISLSDAVWGSNTKGEPWLIDDYLDRTQTYIMSISETDVNVRMRITFYDASKQAISGSSIETRTSVNITIPSEAVYAIVRLAFTSGATVPTDTVVYPMLRLASDTDNTYQPYAKTNQQLTQENETLTNQVKDMNNVLGAKNLYTLTMKHLMEDNANSNWNGNTCTSNGISYTCNFDDAGFLESVTINGSTTADNPSALSVRSYGWIDDMIGQSIIGVMETEDGSVGRARWSVAIRDKDEQTLVNSDYLYSDDAQRQATNVVVVPPNSHYIRSQIYIARGLTLSNVTVKLMICLKSSYDLDPTWQPSSKTNQQLTEDTTKLLDNLEVNGAVNILKYPYLATTGTSSGISITDNGDGTISFAAGTVSSSSACTFWFERYATGMSAIELRGKTVKFSVDMSEALQYDSATARIEFSIADSTDTTISGTNNRVPLNNTHNEWIVTVPSNADHFSIMLWIAKNTVLPSFTLSPMITLASYNGDYVPYAKTNRELTEAVDGMMMKVGRYTKTVKGTNTTYGALIDQICADMKTMIDGFADTNTKVIPMSITIDSLVTLFVRSDQYKKGDNFNIVAYCASCDGTTFNTFYLRGLSGSGNSTIYRQDVTASSQAINDLTSTSFTGDKNISLIYDRYQII